jgi:hypothetical protein
MRFLRAFIEGIAFTLGFFVSVVVVNLATRLFA